jgi:hypothetical protein
MTLDNIEHDTLRSHLTSLRHVASSVRPWCPARNEPYISAKLESQLDDQAKRFFKDREISRTASRVYLSSIFKWFGEDFVKTYGSDKGFRTK